MGIIVFGIVLPVLLVVAFAVTVSRRRSRRSSDSVQASSGRAPKSSRRPRKQKRGRRQKR
jgi:hypothetical protein